MEYFLKLTVISMLLNIGLLKVMHFNDVCLLFTGFTKLYRYTCLYRYIVGILWDVITLGSYISKTIHPIFYEIYRY